MQSNAGLRQGRPSPSPGCAPQKTPAVRLRKPRPSRLRFPTPLGPGSPGEERHEERRAEAVGRKESEGTGDRAGWGGLPRACTREEDRQLLTAMYSSASRTGMHLLFSFSGLPHSKLPRRGKTHSNTEKG